MDLFLYTLVLISLIEVGRSSYEVSLNQGKLLGTERTTLNGRKIVAFLGVPYAKPPKRFQKSELPDPWIGYWNATSAHSPCMVLIQGTDKTNPEYETQGVEDCLYLDVYTPKIPKTDDEPLMDVIVHIHAGSFMHNFGGSYGPKYLLDEHDIVLVRPNYRLGVLGFLSTGDNLVPGNNGLKDQSLALLWVQQNIAKFGGNPNSVTLTGTSAGGASTHYHYLSPLSKGLFHRGMSHGGSSFTPWALVQAKEAKDRAQELGALVGCPSYPSKELVECLKTRPASVLVQQSPHFTIWLDNPFRAYGPVIEPEGKNRFITESPYEIVRSGKVYDVPWIASIVTSEGLVPGAEIVANEIAMKELDKDWDKIAPYLFMYSYTSPETDWNNISHSIKQEYFKNESVDSDVWKIIEVIGDRMFKAYITKCAKLQANVTKSPIYSYQFSYRGKHSGSEKVTGRTDDWGVMHADDTAYIFDRNDLNPQETESDRAMSKKLVDMVATFAKTSEVKFGDIEWGTVNSKLPDYTYLNIQGPDKAEILHVPEIGRERFWMSLNLCELERGAKFLENNNKKFITMKITE